MNNVLQHSFSFPIHSPSKLCRFAWPHHHRHLNLTRTIYAATRRRHHRRRHHRRRLLKHHPSTDDSFSRQSDQQLQLVLTIGKISNSKPVSLLSEVVDSCHLKFNRFLNASEEAFEDLRILVSVDGVSKRVAFSCSKSTVHYLGVLFAACLIIVVGFTVLDRLLVHGKQRFSDKNGGVIYRRDRSLGGREVAVGKMDTDLIQRRDNSRNDIFMLMLENGNEIRKPFWKRRKRRSGGELPKWWPVSGLNLELGPEVDNKEEYQILANRLIRAIMDKRMRGEDVSTDDIIQLRRICKKSGVRVYIDTENTRDSFYRVSVDFVLKYCESIENQSTFINIHGEDARHFIAGLAGNIALESGRAARMVSAAVAARTRSCFLQAWALQIQGNHFQAADELLKICLSHRIFPPDENSAEMEMVAWGLKKQLNLEQRELLLNMLIRICGEETRRSVTEALGLVEPQSDLEQPEINATEVQDDIAW